tara:strand:- start:1436 stop:1738 length:303 start_codon:yes stop_codon:yes gene_type:complete
LPWRTSTLEPTGVIAITTKKMRIKKLIIKKYDSKLIAKKSYIFFKVFALSFGLFKTYDERIIRKKKVINITDVFQSGLIFNLNILNRKVKSNDNKYLYLS